MMSLWDIFAVPLQSAAPGWFGDSEESRRREYTEEEQQRLAEESKRLRRKAWDAWAAAHNVPIPPH
jgi:hypothetical protein